MFQFNKSRGMYWVAVRYFLWLMSRVLPLSEEQCTSLFDEVSVALHLLKGYLSIKAKLATKKD